MIVLSDSGGVYDALFLVGRSALWDAKVPKTRSGPCQPESTIVGDRDVKMSANESDSAFNTEGDKRSSFQARRLLGRMEIKQEWPVCATPIPVSATISTARCGRCLPYNRCRQNRRQRVSWT